jgi:aspartate carbamoyltransferase catalytic subunit
MSARHLLSIADLGADRIVPLLDLAEAMADVNERPIPKVPALRGKVVVSLFFEDSTRTRLSFETAAKRLSADTMTFSASTSSVKKGESLRDTVETIEAMGVHAMVVRHASSGVPWRIAEWTDVSVINAGDGWHEHPTQALLDAFTIRRELGAKGERPFDGLRIGIVGDVKHSRVARSDVLAFTALGAKVVLIAPPTLLPPSLHGWDQGGLGIDVAHHIDDVLDSLDVVNLLRMQLERMNEALVPSLREYTGLFGLTAERARRLRDDVLVMHPGPMNRGVEISPEAAALPRSVITRQVRNGVAVRMAVLYQLLGSGVSWGGQANQMGDE